MPRTGTAINTAIAAAIGGLDGLAASRDASMGRSWNSPGLATTMAPVVGWGWAPVVQIGSLGVGAAAATMGQDWGIAAMCAGAAAFTRAAAFRLAQGRSSTPIPAQGMVARPATMRPAYPGGGYDNSWDPTSTGVGGGPGNAYMGGPIDAATPAPGDSPGNGYVRGLRYDPNAIGPVTAYAWSGVPGVYGDPRITQKQQASGLL